MLAARLLAAVQLWDKLHAQAADSTRVRRVGDRPRRVRPVLSAARIGLAIVGQVSVVASVIAFAGVQVLDQKLEEEPKP